MNISNKKIKTVHVDHIYLYDLFSNTLPLRSFSFVKSAFLSFFNVFLPLKVISIVFTKQILFFQIDFLIVKRTSKQTLITCMFDNVFDKLSF
jgi:hypothetical protein